MVWRRWWHASFASYSLQWDGCWTAGERADVALRYGRRCGSNHVAQVTEQQVDELKRVAKDSRRVECDR